MVTYVSLEIPYLRCNLYLNECMCVHTQEIGSAVIDITSTICDIEYTIVLSACTGAAPFI